MAKQDQDPDNRPQRITVRTRSGGQITATPGIYKFTRFRSQLEIHFAKELDVRQIRWFYEPERLGRGRYLVDFYLPDCKSWVEVKGQVDSRDHLYLREVADMVGRERHQRLFMYTRKRAFVVSAGNFREITHDEFWAMLTPAG